MKTLRRTIPCLAVLGLVMLAWQVRAEPRRLSLPSSLGTLVDESHGVTTSVIPDPLDWPNWRGPQQNGTSNETGLVDRWNPQGGEGSNLLWKSAELAGRSTPIVMRGKLYTIVRADPATPSEGEKVVCVDAATGHKLWENRFNVYLSDVPDTRVGWSSCVGDPATGRIYALGACGYFQCIDGETGETLWSHSLHEQYGLLSTFGGRTNMPVVFEDLVIVSAVVIGWGDTPATGLMAKPAHRFMAFNKSTGQMVWFNGTRLIPYDTTYSAPTIARLGGQWAMVFGSGDGQVWAVQPRTGEHIWHFPLSRRGLNVSPLVHGETVYMGHAEENIHGTQMGVFVAIDGRGQGDLSGKELWRHTQTMIGKSSPILVDGRIYAVGNGARLYVFDAKTGEQIVRKSLGGTMFSSPVYADGKIYLGTSRFFYTLKPTPDGVEVVNRTRWPRGEESLGSPVISHGRIYVPTTGHLYCIGVKGVKTEHEVRFNDTSVGSPLKTSDPAHLQIVPCEVLLKPGETQKFSVRLFDARGEFVGESPATFSLSGPGTIAGDGSYAAPTGNDHTATIVTATVGDLKGKARLRVVPPLPWRYDFNDADDVPLTWIGGRVRYVLRDVDGERIMVKRDLIPTRPGKPPTKLGTRSRLWMGPADLSDYTIQVDIQGQIKDNKMPDAGLINQRYTFELQGASQKLQIRTWATVLRMAETIDFAWDPNVWYTMKLSTAMVGDEFRVQGKVWPRDSEEPAEWTIQAVDPSPNLQGSPGLFGSAKDAEIYWDNIVVTPNSGRERPR